MCVLLPKAFSLFILSNHSLSHLPAVSFATRTNEDPVRNRRRKELMSYVPVDSKANCFIFSFISPQSCEGHSHTSICHVLIEHSLLKVQDSNFPIGSELMAEPGVTGVFLSSALVYQRRNRRLLLLQWPFCGFLTFSGINS